MSRTLMEVSGDHSALAFSSHQVLSVFAFLRPSKAFAFLRPSCLSHGHSPALSLGI